MNNPDTIESLQALSPDEVRVRVAELLDGKPYTGNPSAIHRFTESLDSCREFEDAMTDATERLRYCQNLRLFTKTGWPFTAFATPLQKCQAYILTKGAQ